MTVNPIPAGYHTITPYLMLRDAARAIDFYRDVFGAVEVSRFAMPDGRVGHAELRIGDSNIMLADEFPEMGYVGPATRGGTTVGMQLYVTDCAAVYERAVAAGSKVLKPLADQFYGDRSGTIEDPFGHWWTISTHIEDVSEEEMARRAASQGQ
ncbi:MAG: Glyoxalase/bleomycin resistance protein/dioxygenase [Acidobacteria bacterium]|jgi:PhnB protein|nr:Glyoxalase/bleomycin resistance protein/dioxygenase [Acidobacteriota bacterium]